MKPLPLVVFLLAVLAVALGAFLRSSPEAVNDELVLPDRSEPPVVDGGLDSPGPLPGTTDSVGTPASRREPVAESGATRQDDGWLLRGRVLFAGAPLPGSDPQVLVTQPLVEFEAAVALGPRGSFELRVPRRARSVMVDLDDTYHFLAEPLRVSRPAEGEEKSPARLEAVLGGRMRVTLVPPAGHDVAALEDAQLTLSSTSEGRALTREAQSLGGGRFELRGVAETALWELNVRCAPFVSERRQGERVFAGETRELSLELQAGVRLAGEVRGPGGAPVPEAVVRIERFAHSDTRSNRWLKATSAETDGEGHFTLSDVRAGDLRVRVEVRGAAEFEQALGTLADGDTRLDLVLELESGGRLSGRVLWPSGSPAARADVHILREREPWIREARVRTDAAGAFQATGLGDGPYLVTARAEHEEEGGLLSARAEGVSSGAESLELVLGPGDRIEGVALDDRGLPLERFTIVAVPIASSSAAPGRRRVRERVRADDGRFAFGGLAEGPWDVRAEARDHADASWARVELPDGGGELEFTLARLAAVRGVVQDPTGAPIEGAKVSARFPGGGEALAKSDADGVFELDELAPGETELVATLDGKRASAPLELALDPAELREGIELGLRVGARLIGKIDASVEDFAGRRVLARPVDGYTGPTTLPDEEGQFTFEGLEPGRWAVLFDWQPSGGGGEDWIEGYQRRAETEVELAEGETTHVVLGTPPDGALTVSGTITDGGEPCPLYILYVYPDVDEPTTGMPLQISRADEEGRYALQVPGPGKYRFTVGESVNSQVRFFVDVGEGPNVVRDFEMPGQAVAGRVVLADGGASPRHTLMLVHSDVVDGSRAMGNQAITTTDVDGSFRFEGVVAGEYRLRTGGWGMDSKGLGVCIVPGLVVEDGEDLVGLVVEVQAAAVIEGRVIGADGQPAQDVLVTPFDDAGRGLYRWQEVRTDHTGAFRFDDLGAGRVRLTAELPDGRVVETQVEARAGDVTLVQLRP